METLGKTNGVAGLRDRTSRENQKNEANAQLLANNDQHLAAIGAQLVEILSTRVDILIEYPEPESEFTVTERVDALDERLAELFDRLDSVERAVNGLEDNSREAALAVCGENDEGFVREDDMPDQISRHCGETLDPDEISELIKKTVVEILLHNVCIGIEPHGDPKLESAVLD